MSAGLTADVVSSVVGANLMCTCSGGAAWSPFRISVEEGRISSVVPDGADSGNLQEKSSPGVFDASGLYAIPGLINAHAHLFSFGDVKNPDIVGHASEYEQSNNSASDPFDVLARQCAAAELASGVTTLRCMGDFFEADLRLRNDVLGEAVQGPHILCCGRPLTVSGGHGDGPFSRIGETSDDFKSCTRKAAAQHPDFVKIFATGGVVDAKRKGEPGELKMNAEQISAVCETAHSQGLQVSAHAESTEGVELCLEAGVDFIEHGAALSSKCIELFQQTGATLVQTLSPAVGLSKFARQAGLDATVEYNARFLFEQMLEGLQQARQSNIPVALGNDASCAFVTHYDFWREIAYTIHLCGLSAAEAINCATAGNAAVLQMKDTGKIKAGLWADIVFYRDNPLEDIHALAHPEAVLCRGVFAPLSYRALPNIDALLEESA